MSMTTAHERYIEVAQELTRFMRDDFNVYSREDNKKFDELMKQLSIASTNLLETSGAKA
tara:strand:- start:14190 stop:14366 length:177 start_codon:yes stop_codon:yes gene_type:complete